MSVQQALAQLPVKLQDGLFSAYNAGGDVVDELMGRGDMEPTRALMAGLAMHPVGREMFEEALDREARVDAALPPNGWPEVIVGGGAHAAIWAATRRAGGGQKPLVLESLRFGGTFAMTRKPSFFLNSRNRPGPIGASGSRDALNVILGAPMQPSDVSGAEYQANADLGLVVRCTLALNAVVRQAKVTAIVKNGSRLVVVTDRGNVIAGRVIIATGIGRPLKPQGVPYDNERMLSFSRFMRRFDQTMFPLRGLGRVAVLGAGDSGRTVIEALTGYGPYMGASVASLDYVPQIDWYGVGKDMTKERWLECNRTRYKALAALFPDAKRTIRNARVVPMARANSVFRTTDGVQINGQSYDTAVCCLGFDAPVSRWPPFDPSLGLENFRSGTSSALPNNQDGVLLGLASSDDRSLVVVGPAADIPFEDNSDPEPQIEENRVALFRLAPRTATLASMLPTT